MIIVKILVIVILLAIAILGAVWSDDAVDGGACDFSGQGKNKYGR